MRELDIIFQEIEFNKKSVYIQQQVKEAEFKKELEMLDKFEQWARNIKSSLEDDKWNYFIS